MELCGWPAVVFPAPAVLGIVISWYVRMMAFSVAWRDVWRIVTVSCIVASVAHLWRVISTVKDPNLELKSISLAVNSPFLYTNVTFSLALIRTTAVTFISVSLVFTRISEIRFINNSEGESSDVISPFPSIAFVTTVRIHSLWRCWRSAGSTRRTSTVLVPFLVSTAKTKDYFRPSQEFRLSGLTLIRR